MWGVGRRDFSSSKSVISEVACIIAWEPVVFDFVAVLRLLWRAGNRNISPGIRANRTHLAAASASAVQSVPNVSALSSVSPAHARRHQQVPVRWSP